MSSCRGGLHSSVIAHTVCRVAFVVIPICPAWPPVLPGWPLAPERLLPGFSSLRIAHAHPSLTPSRQISHPLRDHVTSTSRGTRSSLFVPPCFLLPPAPEHHRPQLPLHSHRHGRCRKPVILPASLKTAIRFSVALVDHLLLTSGKLIHSRFGGISGITSPNLPVSATA